MNLTLNLIFKLDFQFDFAIQFLIRVFGNIVKLGLRWDKKCGEGVCESGRVCESGSENVLAYC